MDFRRPGIDYPAESLRYLWTPPYLQLDFAMRSGISRRHYACIFSHEYYGTIGRAGAVHDTLRDYKTLLRLKIYRSAFEVDNEVSFEHEKELVVVVMLVPVILSLHDAKANYRIVHFTQRLVIPLVRTCFDE